ncbi:MAG: hypothetical protein HZC54_18465 [Verrucomicrobia bacterium]|nr:hypothetical protein [Verrucomicrobiota bacterium]
MNAFPAVDPIPLPAPVWLFKALHIVTLALHFCAVELLLGGLLVAVGLCFFGGLRGGTPLLRLNAAASLTRRLPLVMTYVINLGVPPLLFTQVLYGRAFYTSSVLIGVYWFSVIFLLMGCYWLLYRFDANVARGRAAWWLGLLAFLLAGTIAKILSMTMTLMIRPEVWQAMYSAAATGNLPPPPDPTLLPRWLFMVAGGVVFAGLWMIWLGSRNQIDASVRSYLAGLGGKLAVVAVIAQLAAAHFVFHNQPDKVREGLVANPLYLGAGLAWFGTIGLILLAGAWAGLKKPTTAAAGWLCAALGLVAAIGLTVFRDGIRDLTLLGAGYDVWQRTIVTNWSVVGLFLALFVIGLATIGWLVSVMVRAEPVSEKVV